MPLKEFKESLSWIKDGWERNWERVNREIIEVQENVIPTFRNEMKYVTTVNENGIKEIFLSGQARIKLADPLNQVVYQ